MAYLFTVLIICSSSFYTISGFPFGAPEASCLSMFPKHEGTEQQKSISPFSITLSESTYTTANITVTIASRSGKTFKGIDIRARRVTGDTEEVLGKFFTAQGETRVHTINCFGGMSNMLTHSSKDEKRDLVFTWQPPTHSVGNIVFIASFVADFTEFWTDVRSSILTNSSPNPDRGSLETVANTEPPMNMDELCGQTKGCFLVPPECTGSNCDAAVSYKTVGDTVEFEMFGRAEGWVSVGFSEDKIMGMDETITCTAQGSRVTVQRGFNPHKYNERQYTHVLSRMSTKQRDGRIYCRFTRPMVTRVLSISYNDAGVGTPIDRTYNLRQNFYMFLGTGYTYEDTDVVDTHTVTPAITMEKVDFQAREIHTVLGIKEKIPTDHGTVTVGMIQSTFISVIIALVLCRLLHV